jgi:hypothetical protein
VDISNDAIQALLIDPRAAVVLMRPGSPLEKPSAPGRHDRMRFSADTIHARGSPLRNPLRTVRIKPSFGISP